MQSGLKIRKSAIYYLPQILKSTFFEMFSNEAAPKGPLEFGVKNFFFPKRVILAFEVIVQPLPHYLLHYFYILGQFAVQFFQLFKRNLKHFTKKNPFFCEIEIENYLLFF